MKGFTHTAEELTKRFSVDYDTLREASKQVLKWQKDYRAGGKHRLVYTAEGVEALDAHFYKRAPLFAEQDGDELIEAVVCRIQPQNPRCAYVVGQGIEGKGVCNIPMRLSKMYRKPGKKVFVRHVDGNTYQIVLRSWREGVEDKVLG